MKDNPYDNGNEVSEEDRGVHKMDMSSSKEIETNDGNMKVYSRHGEKYLPEKATKDSAGFDLRTPKDILLPPGCSMEINLGLLVDVSEMDEHPFILVLPRSSAGCDFDLEMQNTAGIVDADYNGKEDFMYVMIRRRPIDDKVIGEVKGEFDMAVSTSSDYVIANHVKRKEKPDIDKNKLKYYEEEGRYLPTENKYMYHGTLCWDGEELDDGSDLLYKKGERFAQMVILNEHRPDSMKVVENIDDWGNLSRGGFGSTGMK